MLAIRNITIFLLFQVFFLNLNAMNQEIPQAIYYRQSSAQLAFAASEIESVLKHIKPFELNRVSKNSRPAIIIVYGLADNEMVAKMMKLQLPDINQEQAYAIRKVKQNGKTIIVVFGFDANGAMYGALDIAEAIRIGTLSKLKDVDKKSYIAQRGIKFNIPLDLRTPSYSDCGHAAQANIPHMWEIDFWKTFIDNLARHRYNLISLWSLHPFPSMVKVPEYPDVALNDVWRTKWPLTDDFNGVGSDAVKPQMLADYEVLKKMTIDDKVKFWQEVMQYGKDRGIDFYVFTWNIFTYGAEGKHGITCNRDNDTTINYFRCSVRELIKTYPLLAGIGITAGEHMMKSTKITAEQWLWKTYGQGINDALKLQPNRKFKLIHRYHWSAQSEILHEFRKLMCPLDFSFKYSIAHMYSMHNPPFIKQLLPNLAQGKRTWLTVRNDDIYSFRWGDPDYARDYILAIPPTDKIAGFYMGPDGYTWGRDYLTNETTSPRETIFEKQWYSFMLWGRLSFDPTITNDHFKQVLASRFNEVPADKLFAASQSASRIFPEITKFFWGDIDERWFPEACCRRKGSFYTVEHFIFQPVMPESGNLTIIDWRSELMSKVAMEGKTPLQVADALQWEAVNTLKLVSEMHKLNITSKELQLTLGDYESFAHIGNYYAEKIRGAANLALYDATSELVYQQTAIKHLETALEHWKKYATSYTKQYVQPVLYNRVKWVDIPGKFLQEAANDIEIVRSWIPGTIEKKLIDVKKTNVDRPFRL
jgi:hypothetical protein